MSGCSAHSFPVEHLTHPPSRDSHVVSAAHKEVSVYHHSKSGWIRAAELDGLAPMDAQSLPREVIVTSLNWLHKGVSGELLISYMFHGFVYVHSTRSDVRPVV